MITDSRAEARRGLRQRFFAWFHAQEGEAGDYDALVAPYKRKLLGALSGAVLEIGAGTGENFAFYPRGIDWYGVEPNLYMQERLLKRASENGIEGRLYSGTAEELPLPDSSVDAVVSTLVLCSVSDQPRVLSEIKRVLKSGGCFVFIEHVAAPDHSRQWWTQKLIKPLWKFAADGCHPDRDTGAAVRQAGFASVEIEPFTAPLPIASPHIAGTAIKG
ncbi:MAG TPA: class I SAM-dependent methyltransferase [Phototrophicaceae bacterium]|nr:class I SAM-dependent methyltransferase [Phototrophicaceae bacterium]